MAVSARHVAQLADVDLEDLEFRRLQRAVNEAIELHAAAVALQRQLRQQMKLFLRRGERRPAPLEAQRGSRRRSIARQIGTDFLQTQDKLDWLHLHPRFPGVLAHLHAVYE